MYCLRDLGVAEVYVAYKFLFELVEGYVIGLGGLFSECLHFYVWILMFSEVLVRTQYHIVSNADIIFGGY